MACVKVSCQSHVRRHYCLSSVTFWSEITCDICFLPKQNSSLLCVEVHLILIGGINKKNNVIVNLETNIFLLYVEKLTKTESF